MQKNLLLLFFFSASVFSTSAQEVQHSCGFDHWRKHVKQNNPDRFRAMNDRYAEWIEKSREKAALRDDEVYQVPVVFHVVYNTPEQNLADSVILSQLEVLNEDYRRMNANASETREVFMPVAADVGIEFVLAEFDPQGNPTNGIVRVETDRSGFELDLFSADNTLDEVKSSATGGSDAWNTEEYINIWICNIEAGFLGQIFGMAYPPEGTPNWPEDATAPSPEVAGVLVHFTTVGRNNPHNALDGVDGNDQGRTMVHEMGHYFGLRHTWGDALPFFGDGCAEDDGFADTPNCEAADNFQCNHNANTCVDEPTDFPDMVENYMDYSPDACMNLFTQEQADMMRFVLTELRPGLLTSGAVNVQETTISDHLLVFPNPVRDQLTVQLRNGIPIDRIQIYDQTGRVLGETEAINATQTEISMQHLAPGHYLVRIVAGGQSAVRSVVRF
jgi:hypothetical protein